MRRGLLGSIGSSLGLVAPKPPVFAVPPKLAGARPLDAATLATRAGVTADETAAFGADADATALLDYLLNQNQDMLGATRVLANAMTPNDGVKWAVDACHKVEEKLPPEHRTAIAAVDEFVRMPNASTREQVNAVAETIGMQTPAGLAARAASLADVADAPPVVGADTLVPACVVGAVVCAVALSAAGKPGKPPPKAGSAGPHGRAPAVPPSSPPSVHAAAGSRENVRNARAFQPFIEAGLAIAAGIAGLRDK